jgi:hypothetical protein
LLFPLYFYFLFPLNFERAIIRRFNPFIHPSIHPINQSPPLLLEVRFDVRAEVGGLAGASAACFAGEVSIDASSAAAAAFALPLRRFEGEDGASSAAAAATAAAAPSPPPPVSVAPPAMPPVPPAAMDSAARRVPQRIQSAVVKGRVSV